MAGGGGAPGRQSMGEPASSTAPHSSSLKHALPRGVTQPNAAI